MKNLKNPGRYTAKKSLQIDPPKRTITSSWNVRNDSSNVNSILQPDCYLRASNKCTSSKGVYKKCILSDNSCYCKEKRIRPKLMSRPKSCMTRQKFRGRYPELESLRQLPIRTYTTYDYDCVCKERNRSDSFDLIPKLHEDHCSCLKYTPPRQEYDVYREIQEEKDLRELENHSPITVENNKKGYERKEAGRDESKEEEGDESKEEGVESKEEEGVESKEEEEPRTKKATAEENYSISTLVGTRHDSTRTASSNPSEAPSATVRDLNAFRSEHYFETHSTEDLVKEIPRHICVHQFRLDGRLLPEALNVDAYGRSRCNICSRHMEGDTMQLSKSYFGDSTASLKNIWKRSELGLVPRSVSVGGSKSKIELLVEDDEKRKFAMFVGKLRRPDYCNSFALRQQRLSY